MTSFHFSCGNSSQGPIGFCARVEGETKEEALETLRDFLSDCEEVNLKKSGRGAVERLKIEYCNVYITPENVNVNDIDDDGPSEEHRYVNYYRCTDCDYEWVSPWSCTCDDRCPKCNTSYTPYKSEDQRDGETQDQASGN